MDHNRLSSMRDKLQKRYGIDVVRDVVLSPDNTIVTFLDAQTDEKPKLEVVSGSLTQIGLEDTDEILLSQILACFDGHNAYAEISGKKEHFQAVFKEFHDFDSRPNVTFPIRTNKGRYWIRVTIFPVPETNRLYAAFIVDVTSFLLGEEELFRKTHRDALTGVFNKYTLDYHYGLRYQFDNFHVMFLDLDNFKDLNDSQGHPCGNRFLSKFAAVLKSYQSEYNLFYRIGGDEFVGLFFDDSQAIKDVAKSIINDTRQLAQEASCDTLSVSIGIVKAEQRDDVIRKADNLLYQVKAEGKDRCMFKLESELD